MASDPERFLALVRRELGAVDARVVEATDAPPAGATVELSCPLPDGRVVIASFDAPIAEREREPKQRRLEMLASTLGDVADDAPPPRRPSRPPAALALRDELVSLCERAAAANALVIDANSPVVWGAARGAGLGDDWAFANVPPARSARDDVPANDVGSAPEPPASSVAVDAVDPSAPDDGEVEATDGDVERATRDALVRVRALDSLAALRKGRHLRHVDDQGEGPFVAHSFAGIYLLVLVYAAPFDELRAERSIAEALPRIEQLVLALPPLDPSPTMGAAALARRPRRR